MKTLFTPQCAGGIKTDPRAGASRPGAVWPQERDNQRLVGACAEFEAIFVEQLFKSMRASVPESGVLGGGRAEEIYTGMLDRQIALEMARGQGTVGLAKQMQTRLALEVPSDATGNDETK